MKKCIFHHWSNEFPHEGDCIDQETKYEPRDAKEAQYGIDEMARGFSQGYHLGLTEGYRKAKFPEICHCHCCRSHGELCH